MSIIEATAETWDSVISNKEKPVMTMFYMETKILKNEKKNIFSLRLEN